MFPYFKDHGKLLLYFLFVHSFCWQFLNNVWKILFAFLLTDGVLLMVENGSDALLGHFSPRVGSLTASLSRNLPHPHHQHLYMYSCILIFILICFYFHEALQSNYYRLKINKLIFTYIICFINYSGGFFKTNIIKIF